MTEQNLNEEKNHAQEQAVAQANSIVAMVAALNVDYDRLEELRDELESLETDVREAHANHAEFAHADAIRALAEWRDENAEEFKELSEAAGDCKDADEARERIQNDPLDLEVRSSWYNPCDRNKGDGDPSEFNILLCTGGPAVRILGELDEYLQPSRAWIEFQDWFQPWQEAVGVIEQSTLLEYCQQFYFGE